MDAVHRQSLPQLGGDLFLTDGGLETFLIFERDLDLPEFAAFVLLANESGRTELRDYFTPFLDLAVERGLGFILESPTWRANPSWAEKIGYGPDELAAANRQAIELMVELREVAEAETPVVISGCVGPEDDGYAPGRTMTATEACAYHSTQVGTFAATDADMVTAITMTYAEEAIGIARAAGKAEIAVVISFTVETDGKLPSGQALGDAIAQVDFETDASVAYYMVNCAHPSHFEHVVEQGGAWLGRIAGLRANASTLSHAQLDEAEELDAGDPADLAERYADLRAELTHLTVLGGCCGTDHRHVEAIRMACLPDGAGAAL